MKVTNWRRKLAAALVVSGLFTAAPVVAAELNTNLVVDPSFENVDPGDIGPFDSQRLLDWDDTGLDGDFFDDNFTYAYSQEYSGNNQPPGGGLLHSTGGFSTTVDEAYMFQSVDVAAGDTGRVIADGEALYDLSAYFTTYRTQTDSSSVRVRFLDAADQEIGRGPVGGFDFVASLPIGNEPIANQRDWGRDRTLGSIPVGTAAGDIELVAEVAAGNHDGYVDLVDFRIGTADDFLIVLEVDTETGRVTMNNNTGEDLIIDYYEITSVGESLTSAGWDSLQDQDRAGFPAGDGTGNGWEEAGGSQGGGTLEADFDSSGSVDGDDFLIWQAGFGISNGATKEQGDADDNGAVNGDDFLIWQTQFGSIGGGGGPASVLSESFLLGSSRLADETSLGLGAAFDAANGTQDLVFRYGLLNGEDDIESDLVLGAVRYIAPGGSNSVPEPSTCVLVGIACGTLTWIAPRRRHKRIG